MLVVIILICIFLKGFIEISGLDVLNWCVFFNWFLEIVSGIIWKVVIFLFFWIFILVILVDKVRFLILFKVINFFWLIFKRFFVLVLVIIFFLWILFGWYELFVNRLYRNVVVFFLCIFVGFKVINRCFFFNDKRIGIFFWIIICFFLKYIFLVFL